MLLHKEFFPLLKDNEVCLGCTNVKAFLQPDGSIKKFGNIRWFTNLDVAKRHEKLILWKHYTPEEYPKYDNYDAINVDKVSEIPCDYDGVMGVPITFLDNYNPDQFEIIGISVSWCHCYVKQHEKSDSPIINDKKLYKRIFIKKKNNAIRRRI